MPGKTSVAKSPAASADLKLLDQWIKEVYGLNKLVIAKHSGKFKGPIPRPTATPTAKTILKRDDAGAMGMVRAYIVKLQEHSRDRVSHGFMHQLGQRLLKRPLPFGESDLIWLAKQTAAAGDFWEWPLVGIVDALERFAQSHGMSKELKPALEKMLSNVEKVAWHKTERDVIPRLRRLVRAPTKGFSVDQGEPWARRVRRDVGKWNGAVRQRWNDLLCHAQQSTASKPSPEWMARARRLVNGVGAKHFANQIAIWFPLFAKKRTDRPRKELGLSKEEVLEWPNVVSIENALLLKGLIWCCWAVPDERNRAVLERLMDDCYEQFPLGKRFAEGGTACKRALEAMQ